MFNPQIGECVAIRNWDDMVEEFGLTSSGSINCRFGFNSNMLNDLKDLEFVITDICDDYYYGHGFAWSVSKDMIEYPKEADIEEAEELLNYLNEIKVVI